MCNVCQSAIASWRGFEMLLLYLDSTFTKPNPQFVAKYIRIYV